MRFFRLSQLADDIFDAYRNAFLALEAALDETISSTGPRGEAAWLKFALADVPPRYRLDLSRYLLDPSAADPIEQFMDEQYTARRCAVFHAKSGRSGSLLPGVGADRQIVSDALEPLLRLVIDLTRNAFDAVYPAAAMTVFGFEQALRNVVAHGYEIAVLTAPNRGDDLSLDKVGGLSPHVLTPAGSQKLDSFGLEHGFVATARVRDLPRRVLDTVVSYVTSPVEPGFGTITPQNGLLAFHPLPTIELTGVDHLEVLQRWRLDNRQMPKAWFPL